MSLTSWWSSLARRVPVRWEHVRPVALWIGRSARRVVITLVGLALLAVGVVMMVTPGPGIVAIVIGLAVLATEYAWARSALVKAKEQAASSKAKAGGALRRFRRGAVGADGAEADEVAEIAEIAAGGERDQPGTPTPPDQEANSEA